MSSVETLACYGIYILLLYYECVAMLSIQLAIISCNSLVREFGYECK